MSATAMIPAWVDGALRPVEKLAVHRQGLRHQAISVFVMRGREVLLQRRAMNKYHTPGLWANTVCTHPHWGESHAACALRRLDEELGISGIPLQPAGCVEYRADVGGGLVEHELVQVFTAQASPGLVVAPNPDEVMEIAWMDREALADDCRRRPARYTPWLRLYMGEHRETIFGAAAAAP
jgi:isopentenyl-diphosphate Delta-isomerase